jgi:7-keto-8-aminopelargonate synthetase-like enzyme
MRFPGPNLAGKTEQFSEWHDARVALGGFPFSRRLVRAPGPMTAVRHVDGALSEGINFASHDYLSLGSYWVVKQAALEAIERFGLHSAGSTVLGGAIELSDQLEGTIADHLQMPYVTLYPTGWAAGYGATRALIRDTDHIVMDQSVHNALQEGARAATSQLHYYRHLDLGHARLKLAAIRARDSKGGILVLTESLCSTNSDSPDLAELQSLCREFEAMLAVSVSHDLGCTGPNGTGQLGLQNMLGRVDLVIGSFSKVFAANGGFVATRRREVRDYLRYLSPTAAFSSAISPPQIGAALAAFRIVRSPEGEQRRLALMAAVHMFRAGITRNGLHAMGVASPIIPVLVGGLDVARTATRLLAENGVLTNLIEYPAVPVAATRFRFQAMSGHDPMACDAAATRVAEAMARARTLCHPPFPEISRASAPNG